ncbi:MAG TPA: hypothetical protein VG097_08500 [Gemmata sp.]|jgi:hypothetical protein|nr:hypothetical protein [Gemmata sp.]
MSIRSIIVALTLLIVPVVARTAENDDFNPYKNAKVGDFATYKINTKVGGLNLPGMVTQTVTAKTDKEATLKVVSSINGMDLANPPQTVDLTKPYDPTKGFTTGFEGTIKKAKDGKEKVKVNGKEYEATWTSYDLDGKMSGMDVKANIKIWLSKEVTLGVAKLEMTAEMKNQNAEPMKYEITMEPSETGNKKP